MPEITPADYLPAEQVEGPTQQEIQDHHFDVVAQGLGQRHRNTHYTTQITDEDIDNGSVHPALAGNEFALQTAIANASKATNPAERAHWQAEAEKLAARSVAAKDLTVNQRVQCCSDWKGRTSCTDGLWHP